jgi:hypothetical protein
MSGVLKLRDEGLEWRILDDELVALDQPTSTFFTVNAAGRMLWRALAGGTTHEQLLALLIETFGIERAVAERDLDAFLAALDERGLLGRES